MAGILPGVFVDFNGAAQTDGMVPAGPTPIFSNGAHWLWSDHGHPPGTLRTIRIYKSTDCGATWTGQDTTHEPSPTASFGGTSGFLTYSMAYPQSGGNLIYALYLSSITGTGPWTWTYTVQSFSFVTGLWGAVLTTVSIVSHIPPTGQPSGPPLSVALVALRNTSPQQFLFAYFVPSTAGGTYSLAAQQWNGAAWSAEVQTFVFNFAYNTVNKFFLIDYTDDAAGRVHFAVGLQTNAGPIGETWTVFSGGTWGAAIPLFGANLSSGGDFGSMAYQASTDTIIKVMSVSGNGGIQVAYGHPSSGPIWTYDGFVLPAGADDANNGACLVQPIGSDLPATLYVPVTTASNDQVWLGVRTGGVWATPTKVWDLNTLPLSNPGGTTDFSPIIYWSLIGIASAPLEFGGQGGALVQGGIGNNTFSNELDFPMFGTFGPSSGPCGSPAPPLIGNCGNPPAGILGVPYIATPFVSGGTPPYHWSLASGSLPPGLHLDPNTGVISGIPTSGGTFTYTLLVTDSS